MRIQPLGTGERANPNILTGINPIPLCQKTEPFLGSLIPGVNNPPISLHKNSRSEVLLWRPPITWTRGRARGAQNALIKSVQQPSFLDALKVLFLVFFLGIFSLKIGLDRPVLCIEITHVYDQVLKDIHVSQRGDHGDLGRVWIIGLDAG